MKEIIKPHILSLKELGEFRDYEEDCYEDFEDD